LTLLELLFLISFGVLKNLFFEHIRSKKTVFRNKTNEIPKKSKILKIFNDFLTFLLSFVAINTNAITKVHDT
jgi:hypothetical protein